MCHHYITYTIHTAQRGREKALQRWNTLVMWTQVQGINMASASSVCLCLHPPTMSHERRTCLLQHWLWSTPSGRHKPGNHISCLTLTLQKEWPWHTQKKGHPCNLWWPGWSQTNQGSRTLSTRCCTNATFPRHLQKYGKGERALLADGSLPAFLPN